MYCRNCGKYLDDDFRFCDGCGTPQDLPAKPQKSGNKKKARICLLILAVICAGMALAAVIAIPLMSDNASTGPATSLPEAAASATTHPVEEETIAPPPSNGWYENDRKRYYFVDGQMLTGIQTIDSEIYYFYEDGSMAVNTKIEGDGIVLQVDKSGRATAVTYDIIDGTWSEDMFNYESGGSFSYKILETQVFNCYRTGFYLEAAGQYGANVGGTWKIYIRSNGTWEYVQDIEFAQPAGYFDIVFKRPTDFDAIVAFPTVQGNASYAAYYALYDVHMVF